MNVRFQVNYDKLAIPQSDLIELLTGFGVWARQARLSRHPK